MVINDIDGVRSKIKGYKYNNKPTFINKINDIEKTSPNKL